MPKMKNNHQKFREYQRSILKSEQLWKVRTSFYCVLGDSRLLYIY